MKLDACSVGREGGREEDREAASDRRGLRGGERALGRLSLTQHSYPGSKCDVILHNSPNCIVAAAAAGCCTPPPLPLPAQPFPHHGGSSPFAAIAPSTPPPKPRIPFCTRPRLPSKSLRSLLTALTSSPFLLHLFAPHPLDPPPPLSASPCTPRPTDSSTFLRTVLFGRYETEGSLQS